MTWPGRSVLIPVTSAAGMTVPAMTRYGDAGNCNAPGFRVAASPAFDMKASFWSWRFCTTVGSLTSLDGTSAAAVH